MKKSVISIILVLTCVNVYCEGDDIDQKLVNEIHDFFYNRLIEMDNGIIQCHNTVIKNGLDFENAEKEYYEHIDNGKQTLNELYENGEIDSEQYVELVNQLESNSEKHIINYTEDLILNRPYFKVTFYRLNDLLIHLKGEKDEYESFQMINSEGILYYNKKSPQPYAENTSKWLPTTKQVQRNSVKIFNHEIIVSDWFKIIPESVTFLNNQYNVTFVPNKNYDCEYNKIGITIIDDCLEQMNIQYKNGTERRYYYSNFKETSNYNHKLPHHIRIESLTYNHDGEQYIDKTELFEIESYDINIGIQKKDCMIEIPDNVIIEKIH